MKGRNQKKLQNFGRRTCGGLTKRLKNTVTVCFREAHFGNVYSIEMAEGQR